MTDESVEPLPRAAPPVPSESDVSFWNSNSYRSGGDDWRQFLEIDSLESEASSLAVLAAGESLGSLRDDVPLVSPVSELAELADFQADEPLMDAEPAAVVTGFEFLAGTSDDLLPDR